LPTQNLAGSFRSTAWPLLANILQLGNEPAYPSQSGEWRPDAACVERRPVLTTGSYVALVSQPRLHRRLQLDVLVAVSRIGGVAEGPIEASCIALNPKIQTTLRARI
jgi:hypothetical protein